MSAASLHTLTPDIIQLIAQRLPIPWLADFLSSSQTIRDHLIENRVARLHIPMHELSLHTQHSRRRRLARMTNIMHLELDNRNRRDISGAKDDQERQRQCNQLRLLFGLTPTFVANVTSLCLSSLPIQTVLLAVSSLTAMCPRLLELSLKDVLSPEDGTRQQQWGAVFDALRFVSSMQGLTLCDRDGKGDFTGLHVVQHLQRLDITMLDRSQAARPLPVGELTALTQLVATFYTDRAHVLAQLARLTDLRAVALNSPHSRLSSLWALVQLTALTSLVLEEIIDLDSWEHAQHWDANHGAGFRQLVDLRVHGDLPFDRLLELTQLTRLKCAKVGPPHREGWQDHEALPLLRWVDVAAFGTDGPDQNAFVPQAVHRLMPNVEHLGIYTFGSPSDDIETERHDSWLRGLWPSGPACVLPHLRDVSVQGRFLYVQAVHAFAESLHSLTLINPCTQALAGLEVLGQRRQLTQLQLLELRDGRDRSNDMVIRTLKLCPYVVSLALGGWSLNSGRGLQAVTDLAMVAASRAGALRNVSISRCGAGVTIVGVMALAMSPTIESIRVEGCRHVARADARRVLQLVQRTMLDITVVDYIEADVHGQELAYV